MKRQTQQTGVRKYFGDDLVSLQSEPLRALDAIFTATGACVISGCEVAASGDKFDVAPGIVALHATDRATASDHIMVMPFAGVKDVVLPIYLVAECDVVERVYGDGRVKPISYNYFAAASGVKPAAAPSLEVGADGAMRFADAMQAAMAEYASVTADEKASWNAKESAAGAQAKADAALIAAKSYADNSLISAKGYADSAIAALVNGSPAALDTLRELAAALGGDPNFATTVMNAIGERVTVAAFNAALAGKADAAHTHNYAAVGHTHSDYAAANHSHSDLASTAVATTATDGLMYSGDKARLNHIQDYDTATIRCDYNGFKEEAFGESAFKLSITKISNGKFKVTFNEPIYDGYVVIGNARYKNGPNWAPAFLTNNETADSFEIWLGDSNNFIDCGFSFTIKRKLYPY